MTMHPDFRAGREAFIAGEPFDATQRSQWRRGWQAAADARERRAQAMSREEVERWRKAHPEVAGAWDGARYKKGGA